MHADGTHWQPRAEPHSLVPGYHAGAGDSENATTQAWGRPPELGFQGYARVIVSWVWVSRFGVLQVSAGSAQIVSACEKLYSSIAVSKN